MADLNNLLKYLSYLLPSNKLLQVLDQIQSEKTGTNVYLSCEEFLDNVWKRDELRRIYEIGDGKKENDEKTGGGERIVDENEDKQKWEDIFKSEELGLDCRIKKIEFEKLKYYPEKNNEYLFGTSFTDTKGNPKSALILGNNGVGKTSIYQAIEFSFRSQNGEVFLRDYGNKEEREVESIGNLCKKYLANKEYSIEDIVATIETVGLKIGINNPLKVEHKSFQKYLPIFFFISDYEIYKLGRLKFEGGDKNSFRMFIGESLDLGELLWFNKLMGELSGYGEKNENNSANEEEPKTEDTKIIEKENKFIGLLQNEISQFKKEINLLYDKRLELSQLIAELEKSKYNDISGLLNDFIKTIKNADSFDRIFDKVMYLNKVRNRYSKITDCIKSIESENKIIKGIELFESLSKSNDNLLSVLREINCEISPEVNIDPKLLITRNEQFLNDIQLHNNIKNRYLTKEYKEERKNIIEAIKAKTSSEGFKELIDNIIEKSITAGNLKEEEFRKEKIEEIKSDAKKIFDLINTKITQHFNDSIKNDITIIFNNVRKMFLDEKEELEWIDENLDLSRFFSLKMNLKENGKNSKIRIKRYFNTFRHRMFSVLLVISTSFAIMKKLNINFPIVIDDVFHANDFIHRTKIKELIELIIKSHKEIFGSSQELQLIIFTHDDLIFNSIRKWILENNNRSKNDNINFGFYRLLDYEQAEKDDMNEINNVLYEFK